MKQIFSHDGIIKPLKEAQIPADSIESMYGFGVYETLKVRNGMCYFTKEHVNRLLHSAGCIELEHTLSAAKIEEWVRALVLAYQEEAFNIKLLLMGGHEKMDAQLYIFPLAPFFPKRAWYRDGVGVRSFLYERWMPQSKSLNMLPSYYYYRKAQSEGKYDALFVDSDGNMREGSRTNIYFLKDNQIFSPPKEDILEGVTMMSLEQAVKKTPFEIMYKKIPYTSISTYDSVFLTSTSTKIIPVNSIDAVPVQISDKLRLIMRHYNEALDSSAGILDRM